MEYNRLKENIEILNMHNELRHSVMRLTDYKKNEVDLIRELVHDCRKILNKIEQGTLIELPCKVGDTVYFVYGTDNDTMRIDKGKIESLSIDSESIWFRAIYESGLSYWHTALGLGIDVFLTREEAEKRLKELQK